MTYLNSGVNTSPTYTFTAGVNFQEDAFILVATEQNGHVVPCPAGTLPVGVLLAESGGGRQGSTVHVQIKDTGLVKTGGAISPGMEITAGNGGKAVPATGGDPVFGIALTESDGSGGVIQALITHGGYKA